MDEKQDVPQFLYRGILIDYNNLSDFTIDGVPMVMPYKPYIDSEGRETVHDGNEYGIYMSSNLQMSKNVYGKSNFGSSKLSDDIYLGGLGGDKRYITLPQLEVIYKISTNNLQVRKPWIQDELQGVYNNGFSGEEWIADEIPSENYERLSLKVSNDILHDEEEVTNLNIEQIKNIFEGRKNRLNVLINEMQKISPEERKNLDSAAAMQVLKSLYGKEGFYYAEDKNNKLIEKNTDVIDLLMQKTYMNDKNTVDYNTLISLQEIKNRIISKENKDKDYNLNDMFSEKFNKEILGKFKVYIKEEDYYTKYGLNRSDEADINVKKLRKISGENISNQSGAALNKDVLDKLQKEYDSIQKASKIFKHPEALQSYNQQLEILQSFEDAIFQRENDGISTNIESKNINTKSGFKDSLVTNNSTMTLYKTTTSEIKKMYEIERNKILQNKNIDMVEGER